MPKPITISPVAAAVSAALASPGAAQAQGQVEVATGALEEIIVTATKREQNLQKIPASIHALPEAMLKEIGALNTEDYVRFMPSVNWINFNTGGSNQVIFRGINTTVTGFIATQSSSVYLDEIPLTATNGSQPEIRMLDIQRTEALSGPQGTLFGAAAQAGTLRIITNKPDTSKFEASADVMWRTGSDSDPSHSVTGVLNIPLVEDTFAIRLAAQSAEDGGYIDNVLGHTPDTWFGESAAENAAGGTAAPRSWGSNRLEWGSYSNEDVAEENWNSAEFANLRVSARWNINDNWTATAAYNYGDTDSQGSSAYNPFVGDLQTIGFVKNFSQSEWDMSSLTIEADLGFAQLVSATSFYENERKYVIDNTLYYKYYTTRAYCGDNGVWADIQYYWLWENTATGRAIYAPLYCVVPVANPSGAIDQMPEVIGIGEGPEWQERFTQEIRLSHEGERFDWLAGLYYEDSNDSWNSNWMADANVPYQQSMSYAFMQDCANAQPGDPLYSMWNCSPDKFFGIRSGPDDVAAALPDATMYWTSWDDTDWKTEAVFGEFTWHATAKTDVTVGGRWFETTNDKAYTKILAGHRNSDGRLTGGFIQPRWDGNDVKQTATISEFVPKFSVTYNLDDEKMLYGLYTEGYRTGGVNRANKNADWSRTLFGQAWDPDKLANYEFGLKSRWADNSLQLNLTVFHMEWEDFQFEVVDPSSNTCVVPTDPFPACPGGELPWLSIVGNVGDAHSTGVTAEFDWVPAEGWSIGGNAQWLEAEIDKTPSAGESGIEKGQQLPNTPELQGALWASKSWPVKFVEGGEMFIRGQYSWTGETLTRLVPAGENTSNPSFTNDSYGLADLRIGLVSEENGWQVDLFVSNLTDERAQVWQGNPTGAWQWGRSGEYDHHHNVYTVRPREYGLRFSASWGD
jgi:outer membrane receptor protein involved in Fe transport